MFTQPFNRAQIKEIAKLSVTGICAGNSTATGEFPAQMASNAENVSIWRRHHDTREPPSYLEFVEEWLGIYNLLNHVYIQLDCKEYIWHVKNPGEILLVVFWSIQILVGVGFVVYHFD